MKQEGPKPCWQQTPEESRPKMDHKCITQKCSQWISSELKCVGELHMQAPSGTNIHHFWVCLFRMPVNLVKLKLWSTCWLDWGVMACIGVAWGLCVAWSHPSDASKWIIRHSHIILHADIICPNILLACEFPCQRVDKNGVLVWHDQDNPETETRAQERETIILCNWGPYWPGTVILPSVGTTRKVGKPCVMKTHVENALTNKIVLKPMGQFSNAAPSPPCNTQPKHDTSTTKRYPTEKICCHGKQMS